MSDGQRSDGQRSGDRRLGDLDEWTRRGGQVVGELAWALMNYCEAADFGRVVLHGGLAPAADVSRDPDLQVVSFARSPRGPLPRDAGGIVPTVVVEVRSQTDGWRDIIVRAGRWLEVGVGCFAVLDPPTETIRLFHADAANEILTTDEDLTLPDALPGFEIQVCRLFV